MASDAAIAACPHCGREHEETVLRCPETDLVLPLPGRLLEGKFRLIEQLGRGGMATVWLARHTLVDRNVAIKIIRPEVVRNEQIIARFRGEAKAAGRIAHRNVCEILDFGLGPLGPFIVMERLEGQNLGQVLARWGRLTAAQTVAILAPALEGLIAAHRRGIIHRDLKPENVFLHRNNEGRTVVKLMDFGVAKFTDGSGEVETEQGALLGTPQYMAPEQFKGADLADERTDVWGMGTILYRALSGKDAFRGPTVAATLMKVTHEEPEPLRETRPELSERLEAVVTMCLRKAPTERFPTVEALKEAFLAAAPPILELDDFAWDEEPPQTAVELPAMPGPPIVRRSNEAFPAPGFDLPAPIPAPSATDPLLRALAEAQTVGIPSEAKPGPMPDERPAAAPSAPTSRPLDPGSSDVSPTPSISTESSDRLDLPRHDPDRGAPVGSPAETSMTIGAGTARPAAPARWSQRALVALVLGAVALGGLVWRARTKPAPELERSPTGQPNASAGPLDAEVEHPMAGLPVPPPPGEDDGRALPDAEPDLVLVPDLGAAWAGAAMEAFETDGALPGDASDLTTGGDDALAGDDEVAATGVATALGTSTDGGPLAATTGPAEEAGPGDEKLDEPEVPPPPPAPEDPFGLIRAAEWVTPRELGPISDHNAARRYCESLGQANFAGYATWQLANPGAATKLALTEALPNGRYWTSARWKNKVIVISVPKARQSSRSSEARIARPLCAAKTRLEE